MLHLCTYLASLIIVHEIISINCTDYTGTHGIASFREHFCMLLSVLHTCISSFEIMDKPSSCTLAQCVCLFNMIMDSFVPSGMQTGTYNSCSWLKHNICLVLMITVVLITVSCLVAIKNCDISTIVWRTSAVAWASIPRLICCCIPDLLTLWSI